MFETMSAEQYRALDADAFEARRAEVIAELENAESAATMAELRNEVSIIENEVERRNAIASIRSANVAAVASGAGRVVSRAAAAPATNQETDMYDTEEYRMAFFNYVTRGVKMPAEFRAGTTDISSQTFTTTSDVAPQVPTTMAKEIVKKMSEFGDIWNRVRKLSVQGGLWFRVVDLKPTATWIDETHVSKYQKFENDDKVSFSFYMLECRVSQSLLAAAVTFSDFQALFIPAIAEAMVRALEAAIINGSGSGQPLGILKDPRITNIVEMTAADLADWKAWHKRVKAAMPKSYRNGEFIMAQASFDSYIETMSDDNNAPVSIGYNPVTGEEQYRLMGKTITTVEDDILPDFDAAKDGEIVAIFGDMSNYVVNTQPGMPISTKRWVDDENNQEKFKALTAVDGKVVDPYGFILVKKVASYSPKA